jgi:hypothetical protein
MQYFVTLTLERLTSPPAELESAMTGFVESETKAGTFVITGGLAPQAEGVRVELSPTGGRQGDACLPVYGFAVVEAASLEQATEVAERLLRIHQNHVADWAGTCEVRPVVTHCLP